MKFTTQQRVLVRMDLSVYQHYYMENSDAEALFVHDMSQYSGKVYTIASANPGGYRLEGTGLYLWTDGMLSQHSIEFEVGTRVKYVSSSEPGLKGRVGTVIGYRWNGMNLVEFDDPIPNGHNGNGAATDHGRDGHCWYCLSSELKVLDNETDEPRIVITTNGTEAIATLYQGNSEIKSAEATMPDGVDFDFMGCAKRALKALAKEADDKPVSYSGKIVCIESSLEPFVPGKMYDCSRGNVKGDDGLTYFPIRKLNHDVTSVFCQLGEKGTKAKFVTVSN